MQNPGRPGKNLADNNHLHFIEVLYHLQSMVTNILYESEKKKANVYKAALIIPILWKGG